MTLEALRLAAADNLWGAIMPELMLGCVALLLLGLEIVLPRRLHSAIPDVASAGLLGTLLLAAAFVTWLRPLALGAGLVSVISFILLAKLSPGYNEALRKVVIADWVALVGLLLALALLLMQQRDNLG